MVSDLWRLTDGGPSIHNAFSYGVVVSVKPSSSDELGQCGVLVGVVEKQSPLLSPTPTSLPPSASVIVHASAGVQSQP